MDKNVNIALGSDHAGFYIKQHIIEYFEKKGLDHHDFGSYSDDITDYPDFAHPVAGSVEKGEFTFGIVVCGSGNGVNMVVNKYQGIRSALCWKKEVAHVVRLHNDANVCALPGRYITKEEAVSIVDEFINTRFEGGRHVKRINKIPVMDKKINC